MMAYQNHDRVHRQPDTTTRRNTRRSTRQFRVSPAFGLAPAAVAAGFVLLIGIVASPPRYVARTGFVVDWKSSPSAPDDLQAEQTRTEWRNTLIAKVTSLPQSDAEVADILGRSGMADAATGISKWHRQLRVELAGQTDDCDRFVIQMQDNNPAVALAVANGILHGIIAKLKTGSLPGNRVAPLQSEAALNQFDSGQAEAGPGLGMSPGNPFLNNSIRADESSQLNKQVVGYAFGILFVAVCLGGAAGFAPPLFHQLALAVTVLKTVSHRVPRVKPAKHLPIRALPEIRRTPDGEPSTLPPPFFPSTTSR